MQSNTPVILVVDDDPDMCCNMSDILGDRGYEVETAPEGKTALRMARRRPYDILLLDLRMPGPDGLTLSREVTGLCPETVALLVTAYPSDVGPAEARAAGIHQVIAKPVDIPRLLARIEEALSDGSMLHHRRTGTARRVALDHGV